jgi:methionyl-tRNA formyltransferase
MPAAFRALYLGLPLGALLLLEDGIDVALACISRVNAPGMRRLRRRMADRGRLVLGRPDLESPAMVELIASVKPQLIVSWFWTRRIPADVVRLAPNGFGVHPSILPRYRGADPYFWAIANREAETGVTAHVLTPRYDDGAILAQRKMSVPPGCDSHSLARALDRPSLALMREIAGRYARGEVIRSIPQDDEKATEAPSPGDDDCELLWDWTADEVLARIRAASPEPGAFTGYNEDTVVITRARRARTMPDAPLEPGEIVQTEEGVLIAVADGAIIVTEARREGEERAFRDHAVAELFAGIPAV